MKDGADASRDVFVGIFGGDGEAYKYTMMALNLVFLGVGLGGSYLPMAFGMAGFDETGTGENTMTPSWPLEVNPAGYAFSIWGLIYTLIGGFAVYQAIPSSWLGYIVEKNEALIYNDINLVWIANMMFHSIWMVLFLTNSGAGFILSSIDIIAMLVTAYYLMFASMRSSNNWIEFITMRLGFSIYAGWLTAATILNVSFALRWLGIQGPISNLFFTEEIFGVIKIWGAFMLYEFVSYFDRNPVYGGVFIWVLIGIMVDIKDNRPEMNTLWINCLVALILHSISLAGLSAYLLFEVLQDKFANLYEPISWWSHGIFYDLTF